MGFVLSSVRRYTDALAAYQEYNVLRPESNAIAGNITQTLFASGQVEQARQFCELRWMAAALPIHMPAYIPWGKVAAALQWLTKAEKLRDPLLRLLKIAWQLDPLRNILAAKRPLAGLKHARTMRGPWCDYGHVPTADGWCYSSDACECFPVTMHRAQEYSCRTVNPAPARRTII